MPKFASIFRTRKPWCERALSLQSVETVKEMHVWQHARRMFFGGLIQLFVIGGLPALHVALVVMFFNSRSSVGNSYAPSYWESALPVWGIGMLLFVGLFLLSLTITLPGKRRMKQHLLHIR